MDCVLTILEIIRFRDNQLFVIGVISLFPLLTAMVNSNPLKSKHFGPHKN